MSGNAWSRYDVTKPPAEGVYQWRMPNDALGGALVTVFAEFETRWIAVGKELAPRFAEWDGYRLSVPRGLEWRAVNSPPESAGKQFCFPDVQGLTLTECPFCGQVPTWDAVHEPPGGGVYVYPNPSRLNVWWLNCCDWTRSPRGNPFEIADRREKLLRLSVRRLLSWACHRDAVMFCGRTGDADVIRVRIERDGDRRQSMISIPDAVARMRRGCAYSEAMGKLIEAFERG